MLRGGFDFLTIEILIGLSMGWYLIAPTRVLFLKIFASASLSDLLDFERGIKIGFSSSWPVDERLF